LVQRKKGISVSLSNSSIDIVLIAKLGVKTAIVVFKKLYVFIKFVFFIIFYDTKPMLAMQRAWLLVCDTLMKAEQLDINLSFSLRSLKRSEARLRFEIVCRI